MAKYELIPRVQSTGEVELGQSEMMVFGGCYLGRHLDKIGQRQRRAVEIDLLATEIQRHLKHPAQPALNLKEDEQQETVAQLVCIFNQESSFRTNENGDLEAVLDQQAVVNAALQLKSS